jgi:hypothetical protein
LTEFLQRSKPLVAAINGAAVGVGFTLPLACDIRIASENARVSMRFIRIGLTPELGSTQILPQVAGLAHAAEMMLTGRIYNAQEALRLGVVNKVVPHETLLAEAVALAEEIAFNPATHVRWAKRMLLANAVNDNIRAVLRMEDEIFGQAGAEPRIRRGGPGVRGEAGAGVHQLSREEKSGARRYSQAPKPPKKSGTASHLPSGDHSKPAGPWIPVASCRGGDFPSEGTTHSSVHRVNATSEPSGEDSTT